MRRLQATRNQREHQRRLLRLLWLPAPPLRVRARALDRERCLGVPTRGKAWERRQRGRQAVRRTQLAQRLWVLAAQLASCGAHRVKAARGACGALHLPSLTPCLHHSDNASLAALAAARRARRGVADDFVPFSGSGRRLDEPSGGAPVAAAASSSSSPSRLSSALGGSVRWSGCLASRPRSCSPRGAARADHRAHPARHPAIAEQVCAEKKGGGVLRRRQAVAMNAWACYKDACLGVFARARVAGAGRVEATLHEQGSGCVGKPPLTSLVSCC